MQTLQISNEKALKLYATASEDLKVILEETFGKKFFNKKITDRIQSFEDACAINGSEPSEERFIKGSVDTIAYEKLKEIAKAYREGVMLSFKNKDQRKWYPWHEYSASGFRFGISYCVCACTRTPVGLCVDTEEKSNDFGKKFLNLFEQYKN